MGLDAQMRFSKLTTKAASTLAKARGSATRREHRLPILASASVVVAVLVVVLSSGSAAPVRGRTVAIITSSSQHPSPPNLGAARGAAGRRSGPKPKPRSNQVRRPVRTTRQPVSRLIGQLLIGRFAGTSPTPSILAAITEGHIGSIILFSDNTAGGIAATKALVDQLQAAARKGGNPPLLIMTDQEGGQVRRLPGPPQPSASAMSNPSVAAREGSATGQLLRAAGVNVDLAPVADVSRVDGFMTTEQRTFGRKPSVVAHAACAFARGLMGDGVAYTLKHFPGLGDALSSTDSGPVNVTEPSRQLHADGAAYRLCGADPLALVMVSSASYSNLTGSVPAVLSPTIYQQVMPADGIQAVTISDDFQAPAMAGQSSPALHAINAGLDLVMYAQTEAASEAAYQLLYQDYRSGSLSAVRIQSAAARVLDLKRALGLR